MPAIPTVQNAIDRKLHTIVMEADPQEFPSFIGLARHIEAKPDRAFSYPTQEGIRYARAVTIATYVTFAQKLDLLDADLAPTKPKKEVRSRESFQTWLGQKAVKYLETNNASLQELYRATERLLLQTPPRELPTIVNLRRELATTMTRDDLRWTLKAVSLVRPSAFIIRSRQLYIHPESIRP